MSGTIRTAMILAAGRGERMRPLTDRIPKPLAPLLGKPLIQYHVEALASAGVERIVINLSWLGKQIPEALGDGRRFGLEILYSDEGNDVLGTGGGIHRALPLLGPDAFWVVSADLWTDYGFAEVESSRLRAGDLAHLAMVTNPSFHPQGDFCLIDGRIRETGAERLTYASLGILRPELFADAVPGVFSLGPCLLDAIRKDRVSGERFSGPWHNVGTLTQLQDLERSLARRS